MKRMDMAKAGNFAAVLGILVGISVGPASAGFERWTAEVKKNPFSSGTDVSLNYSVSQRQAVLLTCDSGQSGVRLIAIPGYEATATSLLYEPTMKIAVDGEIILEGLKGSVSAFGANLAGVSVDLAKSDADKLTDAFVSARRQIAVEDGMSSRPFLLTARGSTAAARKLKTCYLAQKGAAEPVADEDVGKRERIAEVRAEIEKLEAELKELEGS